MNEERIELMVERKQLEGRIRQLEGKSNFLRNHIEQANRISLNQLIEAARRLPDAPIDPEQNAEVIEAERQRAEALKQLEAVKRQLEALSDELTMTIGAGC